MPEQSRYNKPIQQLIKVSELALNQSLKTTRGFAVLGKIPPSTGYRVVEAMESRNYITRDTAGNFIRGSETLRVALSAWGLGALFLPCEPVLNQLNEETGATAFLGIYVDNRLLVGPVSPGSGADHAMPPINASFAGSFEDDGAGLIDGIIVGEKNSKARSGVAKHALFVRVCDGVNQSQAVIGVLLTRPPLKNRTTLAEFVHFAAYRMLEH